MGVAHTTTKGRGQHTNGLTEQAVGQLARMVRAVPASYSSEVAAGFSQSGLALAA